MKLRRNYENGPIYSDTFNTFREKLRFLNENFYDINYSRSDPWKMI